MSHHHRPDVSNSDTCLLQALAEPPRLSGLSVRTAKVVMAIRLIAVCAANRRDPVAELTCRIGSVPAARAMLDFADVAGSSWPESVRVFRPCCCTLSPDETVFAGMAEAAARADRKAFGEHLAGFIRPERHDRLYNHAVEAVALLP